MRKIIKTVAVIMAIAVMFITCSGFSLGGKKDEAVTIDTESVSGKIQNSVLEYPATNEFFRYDVYTYYVAITECLTSNANVVVPDTIQDLPVYRIEDNVFKGSTTVKSVTMSNNIIAIGIEAFSGCTNLESITLSANLETIGAKAFYNCENLKTITIPAKVSIIPEACFGLCVRLNTVAIEDGKTVKTNTEEATTSKKSSKNKEPVIQEAGNRLISANAFSKCTNLRNIWIPNDFSEIAKNAFVDSTENLTIYGQSQSAAAQFASINLIDFVVLGKDSFKDILMNASNVEKKAIGQTTDGENWKINLDKIFVFKSDFNYIESAIEKTCQLKNGEEVVVCCFVVKNIASSEKFFNMLDVKPIVDGYGRKLCAFGTFSDSRLANYAKPLNGKVKSGDVLYGYIAFKVPAEWKVADIKFTNDMALEAFVYEMNSDAENVVYVGSINDGSGEIKPDAQPGEDIFGDTEGTTEATEGTGTVEEETTVIDGNEIETTDVSEVETTTKEQANVQ